MIDLHFDKLKSKIICITPSRLLVFNLLKVQYSDLAQIILEISF